MRYVFLAACFARRPGDPVFPVTGHVLSIHEASDTIGLSCAPLFARSPDVAETHEIEISTGQRHGAFYPGQARVARPDARVDRREGDRRRA